MGRKKKNSNAFWYLLAGIVGLLVVFGFLLNASRTVSFEEYDFLDADFDNPDAEFVIEKFNDFQCPACRTAAPTLSQVREQHDNVHIHVRHFPLPQFPHSAYAAEAAECARDQGRFWAMYYVMFDHQEVLTPSTITRYARGLGLDMSQFSACMENREKQILVSQDRQEGIDRGVSGTPSIFINGEQVQFSTPAQYSSFFANQ